MINSDHIHSEQKTKIAVVTGGGSGIGSSIARKFLKTGYTTVVVDIEAPEDQQYHYIPADLTRPEEVDNVIQTVISTLGIPDVVVLNAGRGIHDKLTEGNPDVWEQVFKLNVFSALRLIRGFVPEMLRKECGDVILMSSVSSSHAYPYGGIYAATKAAIDMVAETLRLEVQPALRVATLHPGVVDTGFFKNMINGSQTPESIGWGAVEPEQVADAVFFAVSQPRNVALNDIVIRPAAQPM